MTTIDRREYDLGFGVAKRLSHEGEFGLSVRGSKFDFENGDEDDIGALVRDSAARLATQLR